MARKSTNSARVRTGVTTSGTKLAGATAGTLWLQPPPELDWLSVLDKISDAVSIHSATGEILWANEKLCALYGKQLSELKGVTCQRAFHGEGDNCPHEEAVASGGSAQFETVLAGRAVSVMVEPWFDGQDRTSGFVRIVRNVSGEIASEQLQEAARFAALGQILFGIAHSVGTPLNIISGYAEFLLMRSAAGDQGSKELSAILDQTRRIATLFSEMLDMARPPQDRTDPIEIRAVLASALDLAAHHLRRSGVKAEITCRIVPPLIYGEAPLLKLAFFSILLNAVQQVSPGGRLELLIDEAPESPGFLRLEFNATERSGRGHDFSRSLRGLSETNRENAGFGLELTLARDTLMEAGARMGYGAASEEGVPIIVHLPVSGADKSTGST